MDGCIHLYILCIYLYVRPVLVVSSREIRCDCSQHRLSSVDETVVSAQIRRISLWSHNPAASACAWMVVTSNVPVHGDEFPPS